MTAALASIFAALLLASSGGSIATAAAGDSGAGAPQKRSQKKSKTTVSSQERRAAIAKAQVWTPTNVAAMDLRVGPAGEPAFPPNALVRCDYVESPRSGNTRKFDCAIGKHVVKVRYGAENGHVQATVLATRLLWALGFGADRVYPVRVLCRGCSADPWERPDRVDGSQLFDPATVEVKPPGHVIATSKHVGWSWSELDEIDEGQGGATRAQRDALVLLATFMQHTDSKPEQQRLICTSGRPADEPCERPFMFVHDVGMTFGHANYRNAANPGSASFDEWASTPIWRDAEKCEAHMSKSATGTLGPDPVISEAGRKFLADLLKQLTDRQIRDLFAVAQLDHRSRKPGSDESAATVDEWVAAFKAKRADVVLNHCPPDEHSRTDRH
jgi:hypothetical protein